MSLFLPFNGSGQSKKPLDICCIEYDSVMVQLLHFSIQNNSDSNYYFTFANITQSKCLNIIRRSSLGKDTLTISLKGEYGRVMSASTPINYSISDTYYLQDAIAPGRKLELALKVNTDLYNQVRYLKILLPDKSVLMREIK